MTTHDRDKIIAAAIGCIEGPYDRSRAITITGNEIERLYAIAFEDGRKAEREACIAIVETYKVSVGNSRAGELAAEWTMENLREVREAIRARGEEKLSSCRLNVEKLKPRQNKFHGPVVCHLSKTRGAL